MIIKIIKSLLLTCISISLVSCGYQSYEDCLLSEMKGQDSSMQGTAETVCERKFPFEKRLSGLYIDWDFAWEISRDSVLVRVVSNPYKNYKITKVDMKFSTKDCSESKYSDFKQEHTFNFLSDKPAQVGTLKALTYKCMKTDSVYGIHNGTN